MIIMPIEEPRGNRFFRFAYNHNLLGYGYKYADIGYGKSYPSGWGNVKPEIGIHRKDKNVCSFLS
jgi:hypothetical protein